MCDVWSGDTSLLEMGSEKQRPVSNRNRKLIISCCSYCTSGVLGTVVIAAATGGTGSSVNGRFVVAGSFEKDVLGRIFEGNGEQ